ncbi:MAG: hypothetical protein KJ666_01515 [Bacteroidetes bacterium]|nr:hypothetical protein [Bacteroidota bacterium]MBU2584306.1 hypothetical protein [Bacteroidota bacterium]
MKTYTLTLKQKSGLLTELQSDIIYGHFCWRLLEYLGEPKLKEFISLYKKRKPIFTLSDGILKVEDEFHFPRPFIFQAQKTAEKKEDKILNFIFNKANKEKNFITLNELNNFLTNGKVITDENNSEGDETKKKKMPVNPIEESLRVSVQIDRILLSSSEGRLFSYNPKHLQKNVSFVILIKVVEEDAFNSFNCQQILHDVFTLGYGKKKSSGYGQFEVLDFSEFTQLTESSEGNSFYVLGNFLPSTEDAIIPIGYDINTKYGKFGEGLSQSENPFKNPIAFLTAGSCFKVESLKPYYGRITNESEISTYHKEMVQFGMPFTLLFNYNG